MTQKDIPPGSIHHPRINYGLHERVIRVRVNSKAQEAKQSAAEERQHEMMQQKWTDGVYLQPCKYSHAASDMSLSNTLRPCGINPNDLRQSGRAPYSPKPASPTCANTQSSTSTSTSEWNASTAYSSKELADRSRMLLGSSLKSTRSRATALITSKGGSHPSLVEQQTALAESVRQLKATKGIDRAMLVQKYGEEGATAMEEILTMPLREKQTYRASKRPAPREDVEAVQRLPQMLPGTLPPSEPANKEGSEEG